MKNIKIEYLKEVYKKFETWKDIYPEFHTKENKYWHSHQAKANSSEIASNNKRKFTSDEVNLMRKEYDNGLSPKEVWLKYAPNVSWSTIYNIVKKIIQRYKISCIDYVG